MKFWNFKNCYILLMTGRIMLVYVICEWKFTESYSLQYCISYISSWCSSRRRQIHVNATKCRPYLVWLTSQSDCDWTLDTDTSHSSCSICTYTMSRGWRLTSQKWSAQNLPGSAACRWHYDKLVSVFVLPASIDRSIDIAINGKFSLKHHFRKWGLSYMLNLEHLAKSASYTSGNFFRYYFIQLRHY